MPLPHDFDWSAPTRRQALAGSAALILASKVESMPLPVPKAAHGFDFLIGSWTVTHRRLKARLAQSSDWEVFPGTLDVRPILRGLGNIDQNVLEAPKGRYLASSLRVFDRKSANWSVYWIDGRSTGIDKPVVGRFAGKVGRFYNDDDLDGRPIKVRFTYRDLGPDRASWEQAFSGDGGKSWEINWTMDFARRA